MKKKSLLGKLGGKKRKTYFPADLILIVGKSNAVLSLLLGWVLPVVLLIVL